MFKRIIKSIFGLNTEEHKAVPTGEKYHDGTPVLFGDVIDCGNHQSVVDRYHDGKAVHVQTDGFPFEQRTGILSMFVRAKKVGNVYKDESLMADYKAKKAVQNEQIRQWNARNS